MCTVYLSGSPFTVVILMRPSIALWEKGGKFLLAPLTANINYFQCGMSDLEIVELGINFSLDVWNERAGVQLPDRTYSPKLRFLRKWERGIPTQPGTTQICNFKTASAFRICALSWPQEIHLTPPGPLEQHSLLKPQVHQLLKLLAIGTSSFKSFSFIKREGLMKFNLSSPK